MKTVHHWISLKWAEKDYAHFSIKIDAFTKGKQRYSQERTGGKEDMMLIYDENTLGTPQKSLKMLRDTLAARINHRIVVVEIPTNDACCGYLILDKDNNVAVFTGDGFSTENEGEGGAGYRSAQALFTLFGIMPHIWDEAVPIADLYNGNRALVRRTLYQLVKDVKRDYTADNRGFVIPLDNNPYYIRA